MGSDEVNDQVPVELEIGAAKDTCCATPGVISIVLIPKFVDVTTGSTAKIVTLRVTIIDLYPPLGTCLAEILVLPALWAVTVNPLTEATDGSALSKVHAPLDVEDGKINSTLETLSIDRVISLKLPTIGLGAITFNFMVAEVANQFSVADCMARIETSPPSSKVSLFPETVATFKSSEV